MIKHLLRSHLRHVLGARTALTFAILCALLLFEGSAPGTAKFFAVVWGMFALSMFVALSFGAWIQFHELKWWKANARA